MRRTQPRFTRPALETDARPNVLRENTESKCAVAAFIIPNTDRLRDLEYEYLSVAYLATARSVPAGFAWPDHSITALPAALAGICWMLYLTHTTLSVPALMGTIMSMGVATANSVLIISFANERFAETKDAIRAALEAGSTRLRPVMMTALAMTIGMVPMAIGMGEGGEQNAPLGRAVIGGLLFATIATLFFVPVVFAIVRHQKQQNV